jgi:urease accessory protein
LTHMSNMDDDSYLLLLLSDGNLPTGSFVSSSGLESYFKHGFPAITPSIVPETTTPSAPSNISMTIGFIKESLAAYSRLALPFASDAHELVQSLPSQSGNQTITKLRELDHLFESMTLNHVSRRASKAQGVALLTLFSKGFSRPAWTDSLNGALPNTEKGKSGGISGNSKFETLVDDLKLSIRKGNTPGHLPICWGVLTGCLSLSKC